MKVYEILVLKNRNNLFLSQIMRQRKLLMLSYRYKAYNDGVIAQAIDMAINSSGMRDTARVLGISKNTISKALKKRRNHC